MSQFVLVGGVITIADVTNHSCVIHKLKETLELNVCVESCHQ